MNTNPDPADAALIASVAVQRKTIYGDDPMYVTEAATPDGRRLLYFTFDEERLGTDVREDQGNGQTSSPGS